VVREIRDGLVTAEELDDVREAAMAHAKKWGRTDTETCAVFAEFIKQVLLYLWEEGPDIDLDF